MDGVHDMRGMHGFGRVVSPGSELPDHEPWEPRWLAERGLLEQAG